MRKLAVVWLLVSWWLTLIPLPAEACGDKFVVLARCVNYQRVVNLAHPGHLLIVWTAGSTAGSAIQDQELQRFLLRAGHQVVVVEESAQLEEAVRSGQFGVILVDIGDADRIAQRLRASSSKAVVLPVLSRASKADYAEARQKYKCAVNLPSTRSRVLTAVADAMNRKL